MFKSSKSNISVGNINIFCFNKKCVIKYIYLYIKCKANNILGHFKKLVQIKISILVNNCTNFNKTRKNIL